MRKVRKNGALNKTASTMAFLGIVALGLTFSSTPCEAGNHHLARLDFVNIGTPDEEAAHEAAGWGPSEPATHGGNWGGIVNEGSGRDCDLPNTESCDKATRVTWAGDCSDGGCLPPAGTAPGHDPATPDEPDSFALLGRAARVVLDPNGGGLGRRDTSYQLRMRVLDGIGYDAFEVFVRNIRKNKKEEGMIPAKRCGDTAVLVYRFDPWAPENLATKTLDEQWRVHTIDLTAYDDELNLRIEPNALEVTIQSLTAPWSGFSTFGQLAVDWIELRGTVRR